MLLGRETGENIGLRTACKSDKRICLIYAEFGKKFGIARIAVYDVTIFTFCRKSMTTLYIVVDYAEFEIIADHVGKAHGNLAAAHYQNTLYAVVDFTGKVKQIMDVITGCSYIKNVAVANIIVATRDDRFIVAFDCRNVEVMVGVRKVL